MYIQICVCVCVCVCRQTGSYLNTDGQRDIKSDTDRHKRTDTDRHRQRENVCYSSVTISNHSSVQLAVSNGRRYKTVLRIVHGLYGYGL